MIERVSIADLVHLDGAVLLNSCSGSDTGSVVQARCAAEVCQLLILVSKEMFSWVELLVLLAILLDVCLEKYKEE